MIVEALRLAPAPPAVVTIGWSVLLDSGPVVLPSGVPAQLVLTTAAAGDVGPEAAHGAAARAAAFPGRWVMTRQVHGSNVIDAASLVAHASGLAEARVAADGLVAARRAVAGALLAMFSADCALVGIVSREGALGVAHCGWRGLEAGVVQAVASAVREQGGVELAALRSPCICPSCYAFGHSDLARLVGRYGPELASTTREGEPALDLRAGVRLAAEEAGIGRLVEVEACTSCDAGWFSHRARNDRARFALGLAA